jgi:hypothetical protein
MLCISIVTDDMWRQIKPGLIIRMQIDVPGTGIAFTVPLGSIGGRRYSGTLFRIMNMRKMRRRH